MKTYSRPLSLSSLSLLGPGLATLLGCASESVDLGGDTVTQQLQRGSRCTSSQSIDDDVLVTSQAEVAALEGCQEIGGDLTIQLFPDADLRPLHDLRSVEGTLSVGQEASLVAFFDAEASVEEQEALADRDAELLSNGWLDSLSGLESLERVGSLQILATEVADLSVLERLRVVGGAVARKTTPGSLEAGSVNIMSNRNLVDLTGLQNARGIDVLNINDSPSLVSLDGVTLASEVRLVNVGNSPALVDLDALSALVRVTNLSLLALGITDLSALSTLESVEFLGIEGNESLVDASALDNLVSSGNIYITNNAALRSLPSFARWLRVPEEVVITDNPVLENISLEFGGFANARTVDDRERVYPSTLVSIENNAALRSVSIPAIESNTDTAGLSNVNFFLLRSNPSLSSMDFGGLRRVGLLSVAGNAALDTVTLGALARVEELELTDNPQLSAAAFDDVATFERTLSGNLP